MTIQSSSSYRRRKFVFLILLLCLGTSALAQAPDILDGILDGYKSASGGWHGNIEGIAKSLFWKLAAIEFAWSCILWALQQDHLSSFTAAMVKKIIGIGFFYALLLNAPTWIPAIINGLTQAGKTASGTTALTPSMLFDRGIDLAAGMLGSLSPLGIIANPLLGVLAGWAGIFIVISFVIIAGQLMITLIESYIVVTAGVLFLGFGGSRWTTEFAQKYISYAFATGVKLFMIYLLIGVGMNQSQNWGTMLASAPTDQKMTYILVILGGALLLAYLCFQIPNMAASMLSGAPSMSAGSAATTIATLGAGTIAAGGSGISSAADSARGGMQALKAGYSHHRQSGSGVLGSAVKAVGTSTLDYGKEAGRSVGEAVGVANPTESRSNTIGGRAAESRRSETAAMYGSSTSASQGNSSGSYVAPPAQTSAQNQSAGNSSASGSSASGSSAKTDTERFVAEASGKSGVSQSQTRQASDSMIDNAPQKMGSAAAQTTAFNSSASNIGANEQSSVSPQTQSQNSQPEKKLLDVSQVRPPNIPHDAAPQAGINIRIQHDE